jgi:beta-galactosidase/beta-glucuronidase
MPTTEKCAPSPGPRHHAVRDTFGFGIWKSVYLVPVASVAIAQLVSHTYYAGGHPTSILSDTSHRGFDVNVTAELIYATSGTLTVLGSWPGAVPVSAKLGAGSSRVTVSLPAAQTLQARLWQPNGHGEQVRYSLSATFNPDALAGTAPVVASRMIGFRHIAMVTVDDTDAAIVAKAWSQNGTGQLTMMFRVNGAATYARGGNKIPMELLDGRMTAVAHRRLVQSAAEGNFNMLRIWGGAIFEPRAFYDAADEFGIMMYHDMQFAGGSITSGPLVKAELEYQVKRLSHHPSIAMWDGVSNLRIRATLLLFSFSFSFAKRCLLCFSATNAAVKATT